MVISYNWLHEYLPVKTEPEKLSKILTSIGLEVEAMHEYNSIEGGLAGLITGEVLTCEKHPDADKLKITTVNIGSAEALQIVCGANNVAAGQKVVVAQVGTTIYPVTGEPIAMKKAKIRGVESMGMICAEDEIGLGTNHDGIIVLPSDTLVGKPVKELFENYSDIIFEIGLTPNRMDAMSHLGVAKDVMAYLSHHEKQAGGIISPFKNNFKADDNTLPIAVTIDNTESCKRYCGVSISNITIGESPAWMKNYLLAIGVKSINNIVDITNYILHETGQPLHAFDADKITGQKVVVKNLGEGTVFKTLDDKERKLLADDLMICNADAPMCMAGVYGGLDSGVHAGTKNIFLESAWFAPVSIRKTSVKHGLRTDAATRFEKGVDISNTLNVLKRAAMLIKEIAGGTISSDVVDVYPAPADKKTIGLKYHYLKKLSGKNYHADVVKNILGSLGFEIVKDNIDELFINVPYSKPDIELQADVVEEIMRIDGLDNIEIPAAITISPAVETAARNALLKEKVSAYLLGTGFYEIFTNSITNSKYYEESTLATSVKMINNLSADLDIMRPGMLETGLEVVAHNLNRKNVDLRLYEFGKTYAASGVGSYSETKQLALYVCGNTTAKSWQQKSAKADIYYVKGLCENVFATMGLSAVVLEQSANGKIEIKIKNRLAGVIFEADKKTLQKFGIKEPVFYACINWDEALAAIKPTEVKYKEVPKFPAVERDLAMLLDKQVSYEEVEKAIRKAKVPQLQGTRLFDVFESEKIGQGKKSLAVNLTFIDESKTLTDTETEGFMKSIITSLEKNVNAEVRK